MQQPGGRLAAAIRKLRDEEARRDSDGRNANAIQHGHRKSFFARFIAKDLNIHRSTDQCRSDDHKNKHQKDSLDAEMVQWTQAVANYTKWLVRVGAAAAVVAFFTLLAIKGQLNTMATDERPWIEIAPPEDGSSPISSLVVSNNGNFDIGFSFILKNTGKSPTRYISYFMRLYPEALQPGQKPFNVDGLNCDQADKAVAQSRIGIIFPNNSNKIGYSTAGASANQFVLKQPWPPVYFDAFLGGCVAYETTFDQNVHHTWFRYEIIAKKGLIPLALFETVKATDIRLSIDPRHFDAD
jgi:hypothetical protein